MENLERLLDVIDRRIENGIYPVPNDTSFLKCLKKLGYNGRREFLLELYQPLITSVKTGNFTGLNLGDLLENSLLSNKLPKKIKVTKKERKDFNDYLKAYSNLIIIQATFILRKVKTLVTVDDNIVDVFNRAVENFESDSEQLFKQKPAIKAMEVLKKELMNRPILLPTDSEQKVNKLEATLEPVKLAVSTEQLTEISNSLKNNGAIIDDNQFIHAVSHISNGNVEWHWTVTECFYLLYKLYGSEYVNGRRLDEIAFKVFKFKTTDSKEKIRSSYHKFSSRFSEKRAFEEYIEKKQKRITAALLKA